MLVSNLERVIWGSVGCSSYCCGDSYKIFGEYISTRQKILFNLSMLSSGTRERTALLNGCGIVTPCLHRIEAVG